MKMLRFSGIGILFLMMIVNCKPHYRLPHHDIHKNNDALTLDQAHWLLGIWKSKATNGDLTETWKQMNDSVYLGESYVVVKTDTVFYESIRLMKKNKKWNYVVAVKNQNNEQPVSFEMTRLTPTQLVFANPTHDFPSTIFYTQITQDSMMAEISGLIKGKQQSQHFYMKRFN
jgi:hypothetical protein